MLASSTVSTPQTVDCDPLQGTIEETLSPVPWSAWREVLRQNWLLEVFEIHFHCVGRLDALLFPQLTMGEGGGVGVKMEQQLTRSKLLASRALCLFNPWTSFPPDSLKRGNPRGKPSQGYHLGPSLAWDIPHLPVFGRYRDQARDGAELESTPIPGAQPDLDSREGVEIVEVRHTTLESSLGLSPVASAILSKNSVGG